MKKRFVTGFIETAWNFHSTPFFYVLFMQQITAGKCR